MMNPQVATPSSDRATRWWRLDPRVAAHLRGPTKPLLNLLSGALAPVRRGANAQAGQPNAFAPTRWADTEWSDTCSDLFPD